MDESFAILLGFGVLNTLVYAMMLFLLSSGLTVIFGMLGVLNLAHGAFYMLGAYFAYSIANSFGNFWLALLIAPLVVALLGVLIEKFLLRRAHQLGHSHELLLTLGISYIVLESVKLVWGSGSLPFSPPPSFNGAVQILTLHFPLYRFFIVGLGLMIVAILAVIAFKTRLGMIIRAAVSDIEMAGALGFNVKHLFVSVFGAGAYFAGVAGVVAAPLLSVYPGMGIDMLVDTFVVVVVGGLGSVVGAFIASFLVAGLQSFGVLLVPQFAMVFSFALMIVVLILKPMGLYGNRV